MKKYLTALNLIAAVTGSLFLSACQLPWVSFDQARQIFEAGSLPSAETLVDGTWRNVALVVSEKFAREELKCKENCQFSAYNSSGIEFKGEIRGLTFSTGLLGLTFFEKINLKKTQADAEPGILPVLFTQEFALLVQDDGILESCRMTQEKDGKLLVCQWSKGEFVVGFAGYLNDKDATGATGASSQ